MDTFSILIKLDNYCLQASQIYIFKLNFYNHFYCSTNQCHFIVRYQGIRVANDEA